LQIIANYLQNFGTGPKSIGQCGGATWSWPPCLKPFLWPKFWFANSKTRFANYCKLFAKFWHRSEDDRSM
jgi:hypothetical protein